MTEKKVNQQNMKTYRLIVLLIAVLGIAVIALGLTGRILQHYAAQNGAYFDPATGVTIYLIEEK